MIDTIELNEDTLEELVNFIDKASQPPNEETRDFYENKKWKDTDSRLP